MALQVSAIRYSGHHLQPKDGITGILSSEKPLLSIMILKTAGENTFPGRFALGDRIAGTSDMPGITS